jgi:hypothetical protein
MQSAAIVPLASEVAPLLDQGLPHTGVLTKVLAGGRTPIPVVQARIFSADAQVADLVLEREVPPAPQIAAPSPAVAPRTASPASTSAPPAKRGGYSPIALLFLGAIGLAVAVIIVAFTILMIGK